MPELPEIEHLKRTLEQPLIGAHVERVTVKRRDVIHPAAEGGTRTSLLTESTIVDLKRHGKQLAFLGDSGRIACFHLGMSGQLRYVPRGTPLPRQDHVHCVWSVRCNGTSGRLMFRDPRRFGGIWLFNDFATLMTDRWSQLGPDALSVTTAQLHNRLRRTQRPLKAALLDQRVIAGVGNIYADEALHAAGMHPMQRTDMVDREGARILARKIRTILQRAVDAGGSTLRDYKDGNGASGTFVTYHMVYGRAGEPCRICNATLEKVIVAQRTTVLCPKCQQLVRCIRKKRMKLKTHTHS